MSLFDFSEKKAVTCQQFTVCCQEERRKEGVSDPKNFSGTKNESFVCLDAAVYLIVKDFCVLLMTGDVRFLDFLFGERSVSQWHHFTSLSGQRSCGKKAMQGCF